MSIAFKTRFSTSALKGIMLVVCIVFTSGCASTTGSKNRPIKSGSTLHHDRFSDNESAEKDMFLVSVQAQRAYQESRWLEAVSLYQQIVERVPNDAVTWFRLANTYAQQGAFERAIHAYEQSLALEKEQPKAWFNLSTAYLLNAKSAMLNAHKAVRSHDPAKVLIEARLQVLDDLVNNRLEESNGSLAGFPQ